MPYLSKYGVARHIRIPLLKAGSADHAVSADWTPAAGDVKIIKDGGAPANVTNLPTATAAGNSAYWDFSLTATEMQAAQVQIIIADAATKAVQDDGFTIETYGNASAQHAVDLSDSVRAGLTALPNATVSTVGGLPVAVDTSGRVDVLKINGTSQTARDIGASVLLSAGTGTGQLDFTSGVVKANLAQILGTALTETAGQIAAAFKKLFDVGSPVLTAASVNQTGDAYARVGAPAGASVSADIAAAKTDTAAIKAKTDSLTFTVASQVDVNVVDWKGATAPAMTGDAYARLGAPAGASISADIAAAKVDTAAIKAKTDSLTFTVTGMIDANVIDWKGATAPAMTGDAYARLGAPAGASVSADIAAAKVDTAAIKAKTDNLPASPAAVGSAMTLTSGERTTLAAAIEAAIIDDTDGNAVLTAITDKIASVDPNLGDLSISSIAAGVRTELATELAHLDADISSRLATASYTAPDNSTIATISTAAAAIQAKTDSLTFSTAGRLDAQVFGMETDTITAGAVASSAVTELQAGLSTLDAAGVRTAVGLASADLDTQLGAINAKTTNLPASPAATGDIPTAAAVADAVWEEAIADHSGTAGSTAEQLAAAGAGGDPWATSVPGAYSAGEAGYILGQFLDAAVSSRFATGSYTAPDNASIATIKAKTDSLTFTVASQVDVNVVDWKGAAAPAMTGDAFARLGAPAGASVSADIAAVAGRTGNLPDDPADASDIAAAFASVNSTLATIAGYVDTEVAAIKARTDLIPDTPAATGDIPSAADVADAVWDEALAGHATAGSAGATLGTSGDPLATVVPAEYADNTAGFALGRMLSAGTIVAVQPQQIDGRLTIIMGDDYLSADDRAFTWTDDAAAWPDLTDATIAVAIGTRSFVGAVASAGGASQEVTLELTAAQTATLTASQSGQPRPYAVVATMSSGSKVTLVRDQAVIRGALPASL